MKLRAPASLGPFRAVAAQELTVMLRTRWVAGFGVLFAGLVAGFAWFGTAHLGIAGIGDFNRAAVGLVNLVGAIVPLAAILAGVQRFAAERGAEELLYSQPAGRAAILLGKAAGVFAALALPVLAGFALGGAVIAWRAGTGGIGAYLAFAGLTLLLALAFISLALLIAAVAGGRLRAVGAALAAWFALVLLYDLAVIGTSLIASGSNLRAILFASVFLDPVDAVRVAQLLVLEGESFFGPAGAAWARSCGGPAGVALLLAGTAVLWIALPAGAGLAVFRRKDL